MLHPTTTMSEGLREVLESQILDLLKCRELLESRALITDDETDWKAYDLYHNKFLYYFRLWVTLDPPLPKEPIFRKALGYFDGEEWILHREIIKRIIFKMNRA